jgi:hypothetical protein
VSNSTVKVDLCVAKAVQKDGIALDQEEFIASIITNDVDPPRKG